MRALIFRGGRLVVDEVPNPEPDAGQVLVNTLAAGICGSDVHVLDLAAQSSARSFTDEVIWGHEFCCAVAGFGPGTDRRLELGTRVCSVPVAHSARGVSALGSDPVRPGGFAERMVLNESMLIPVPDGLTTEIAALTEPMAVGWHAVARADIRPGTVPLVIGCGPVGLAVIAGLAIKGIRPIIAADFSPFRRRMAERMGADVVLNPADSSPYERWQEALTPDGRRPAAGTKLDMLAALGMGPKLRPGVIFECVGVPGMIQQIMDGAVPGTQLVVVGVCLVPDRIVPVTAITKQLGVQFAIGYTPAEFAQSLQHLADGRIDAASWITGKAGLDDAPTAFADLKNPDQHVKILIEPWR